MQGYPAEFNVPIIAGRIYIYTALIPKGCKGERYKVLYEKVIAVPEYTKKVLVEAITGPDKGLIFVCSPWNFSTRYVLAEEEIDNAKDRQ